MTGLTAQLEWGFHQVVIVKEEQKKYFYQIALIHCDGEGTPRYFEIKGYEILTFCRGYADLAILHAFVQGTQFRLW